MVCGRGGGGGGGGGEGVGGGGEKDRTTPNTLFANEESLSQRHKNALMSSTRAK